MLSVKCDRCGRFARWDAYYGRWFCDGCERAVKPDDTKEET